MAFTPTIILQISKRGKSICTVMLPVGCTALLLQNIPQCDTIEMAQLMGLNHENMERWRAWRERLGGRQRIGADKGMREWQLSAYPFCVRCVDRQG